MKINFKKTLTILCLLFVMSLSAVGQTNWDKVIDAIIYVESKGDINAVNGECCGPMQISPILVKECNNILRSRGIKTLYTLQDRFSLKKSKEMFILMQSKYNPEGNIEKAIRSWNGGPNYTVKNTERYYLAVKAKM